jgi:hypothetical protein
MGNFPFPTSKSLAVRSNFDPAKDNPLQFLHPNEVTCAELFVLASGDPMLVRTMPPGPPRKWGVLRSGTYGTRFKELFGYDLQPWQKKSLETNPAWRAYVTFLQTQTRDAVLQLLKNDAIAAYQDFKWSREEAKKKGDYKETRLAASDHLDRLGATEKPMNQVLNAVIVLKGRNFDEQNLMRELPAMEVEVVSVTEPDGK